MPEFLSEILRKSLPFSHMILFSGISRISPDPMISSMPPINAPELLNMTPPEALIRAKLSSIRGLFPRGTSCHRRFRFSYIRVLSSRNREFSYEFSEITRPMRNTSSKSMRKSIAPPTKRFVRCRSVEMMPGSRDIVWNFAVSIVIFYTSPRLFWDIPARFYSCIEVIWVTECSGM